MTPRESNSIAQAINAMNAKRSARAEAAAGFIVALVLGVLGALALVHFATPCEAGTLCAMAAVPTRTGWLAGLQRRISAALLRWRLRDVELTLDRVEDDLADLPEIRLSLRREANALRAQLARLQG